MPFFKFSVVAQERPGLRRQTSSVLASSPSSPLEAPPAVPATAQRRRLDELVTVQARAANIRNRGRLRLGVAGLASAFVPLVWRRDRAFAFLFASGRSMGAFCRGRHGSETDMEVAGWEKEGEPQREGALPLLRGWRGWHNRSVMHAAASTGGVECCAYEAGGRDGNSRDVKGHSRRWTDESIR